MADRTRSIRNFPVTFTELDEALGSRRSRTICNNTTAARGPGGTIDVRLHGHHIATLADNGAVVVLDAGWQSVTTKQRLNEILRPVGARIHQEDYRWFLRRPDGTVTRWHGEAYFGPAIVDTASVA
jgi:hypothetical protein